MPKDTVFPRVEDSESLRVRLAQLREAQQKFSRYTQEQVDEIFRAAALAANRERLSLAKLAVEETGMGIVEDKVIKNHFASEFIYNAYKKTPTCGVIERDDGAGYARIAEPVGVIAAIVPTTNPTSTAVFKALLALKTRNAVIFSPHPRAKKCTIAAAKLVLDAAVAAGAPEGIIGWIDEPGVPLSAELMRAADLILATGGPGMVRAAYSSGKPAIGVGAGNTPALLDESCDVKLAVNSVLLSKTFDNGMICASEQSVIVSERIYEEVRREFERRGARVLSSEETDRIRRILLKEDGTLNSAVVGQSAHAIAELAGFEVPDETRALIAEAESVEPSEPLAHEKLSPVLAMYRTPSFEAGLKMAERLVETGGPGHTAVLYCDEGRARDKIDRFSQAIKAGRILVNTPSSQGGIGDLYNFRLAPSLTLGCGSWGGNSVSENVGVRQLLNIKTVAERRENMLWFRAPGKIYFKRGCLPAALRELKDSGRTRAFLVTDAFLSRSGQLDPVTRTLDDLGIRHHTFFDVSPDPTLECARRGAEAMRGFAPDAVIAVGGGSAMDAAKIMWLLYEHPDVRFEDLALRFLDIRKRVYAFPKLGGRAEFVAVPTSAGTGSEVTPFAVITDGETGIKYPLADYALLPNMAVVDADLMLNMPKGLTAASGIDALTHAIEAYVSMLATDYTDGIALKAIRLIFENLPEAFEKGAGAPRARERMANAATLAGMAFANAFLGLCHSMAHKLGAFHHLPHGVANALLIEEVMRFNASEAPNKMGIFSQYPYPDSLRRYAEIAERLGLSEGTREEKFEALLSAISGLKARIGIPASIREAGVEERAFLKTLDEMTEQAFDDQCTGANPRYPLRSEIRALYLAAYYGTPAS